MAPKIWIFPNKLRWLVVASLGLAAQPFACYQVVEHNTGIPALYNTALDAAACALKTLVTSTGNQGFVVLGYDLYPALAYVDPYETYRERYDVTAYTPYHLSTNKLKNKAAQKKISDIP